MAIEKIMSTNRCMSPPLTKATKKAAIAINKKPRSMLGRTLLEKKVDGLVCRPRVATNAAAFFIVFCFLRSVASAAAEPPFCQARKASRFAAACVKKRQRVDQLVRRV